MDDEALHSKVNFSKPIGLFPLDQAILLPYLVQKLFIFEPRYRQMVGQALDTTGLIAMAVYAGPNEEGTAAGDNRRPLMPIVCVGQIVEHQRHANGTYTIMLRGLCRARIAQESAIEGDRLYRQAKLEPIEHGDTEDDRLAFSRQSICGMLSEEPLSRLQAARQVIAEIENNEIPTAALYELIGFALFPDPRVRYRILAEGDIDERGALIERELKRMKGVMDRAIPQWDPEAPPGVTWN